MSYKGIAEGVENSNFLLHTTSGSFILTLYEKRVAKGDLPFFLGLMTHLASRGVNCPQPVKDKSGEALRTLAGRPAAIITFLEGIWPRKPNAAHCAGVGKVLATNASGGRRFSRCRAPMRCRCRDGGRCSSRRRHAPTKCSLACARFYRAELDYLESNIWPKHLPVGVIHADLFPDNVFFLDDRVSGHHRLHLRLHRHARLRRRDLPQCLVLRKRLLVQRHQGARAVSSAYGRERQLSKAEEDALPLLARGSALRFLLTRLVDFLNVPKGALVRPKDPLEYVRKLRFHQSVSAIRDYGVLA